MLYTAYRSTKPVTEQDDISLYVQRIGGWLSIRADTVVYIVPDDRAYMLSLFDPSIQRYPQLDYIV